MEKILVLDWGGTAIKTGLYENGRLNSLDDIPTPSSWQNMKEELKRLQTSLDELDGVAISAPGAVDTEKGIIYGASAIPYIHNFEIRAELEELFGLPVSLQNDANCAALAELWQGRARDVEDTLVIVIGSGIGGGVILDGKLKVGQDLFGGEFGYMILDWQTGATFSELTSPVWISRAYAERTGNVLSGQEIFDLSDQNDPVAKEFTDRFYRSLAAGIFNLLVTLNPNRVLLGGGISRRPGLAEKTRETLDALILEKNAAGIRYDLQTCEFLSSSNMMGAVAQFLSEHETGSC